MTRSADAQPLSLGVLSRSRKANERRLPIHPDHLSRIDSRIGRESSSARIRLGFRCHGRRTGRSRQGNLHPRANRRRKRRHPVTEGPGRGSRRTSCGTDPLGMAALRAGRRPDPDRHRPAADADRVRGDEPLARPTADSACTCSTRTTSSRATAPCCTPCSSPASPATTAVGCAPPSSGSARPPAARSPR